MIKNREIRETERKISCDVLVAGGGIAGVMAAAAASKSGAETILVEAAPFLGGVVTMGTAGSADDAGRCRKDGNCGHRTGIS